MADVVWTGSWKEFVEIQKGLRDMTPQERNEYLQAIKEMGASVTSSNSTEAANY